MSTIDRAVGSVAAHRATTNETNLEQIIESVDARAPRIRNDSSEPVIANYLEDIYPSRATFSLFSDTSCEPMMDDD